MADVQFEEDSQFNSGGLRPPLTSNAPTTPGMVRLLGRLGIQNEKIAGYILVAIVIIASAVAVFIFAKTLNQGADNAGPGVPRAGPPAGEL